MLESLWHKLCKFNDAKEVLRREKLIGIMADIDKKIDKLSMEKRELKRKREWLGCVINKECGHCCEYYSRDFKDEYCEIKCKSLGGINCKKFELNKYFKDLEKNLL